MAYNDKKGRGDRSGGSKKRPGGRSEKPYFNADDRSSDRPQRERRSDDGDDRERKGPARGGKSFSRKSDGPKRDEGSGFSKRREGSDRDKTPAKRSFSRESDRGDRKPFRKSDGDKEERGSSSSRKPFGSDRDKAPTRRRESSSRDEDFGGDDRKNFRKSDGNREERGSSSSRKPFGSDREKAPTRRRESSSRDEDFGGDDRKNFRKSDGDREERGSSFGRKKPFTRESDKAPARRRESSSRDEDFSNDDRKSSRRSDGDRSERSSSPVRRKPFGSDRDRTSSRDKDTRNDEKKSFRRSDDSRERGDGKKERGARPYDKKPDFNKDRKPRRREDEFTEDDFHAAEKDSKKSSVKGRRKSEDDEAGLTRLNKYIANAGICSRREADDLIKSGVVSVNGKAVTEMGYKVKPGDVIKYNNETLKREKMMYVLLNKPKDYITTLDDPSGRKTVLELVHGAGRERIYPVGRLDRATTGVLLLTNDGELTKRLTHPRYGVQKIYHVELDKSLKPSDMDKISEGIELEDGIIKADEVAYVGDGQDKTQVGIKLHSGRNRIVRRIFEHLGYNVRKLDRVTFAGLTKKDLPRGRWRHLTEKEVGMLYMAGTTGKEK
jgi:23S rRNA pseudouridine2605 synthase